MEGFRFADGRELRTCFVWEDGAGQTDVELAPSVQTRTAISWSLDISLFDPYRPSQFLAGPSPGGKTYWQRCLEPCGSDM